MKEQNKPGMWHLYKQGGITPAVASMFGAQNAQQMAFIRSVMKEQRKKSMLHVPLKQLELVVFDLETTGFSPDRGDEIISVGAVKVVGEEIIEKETFYSLINPKRGIPLVVEQLTGLTNEMVLKAPELIEVLQQFLEFVGEKILIAHGSGHDKQFLNAALWKTSRVTLTHRLLDTMMIGKCLDPSKDRYGLDAELECYHIPVTTRHHAFEDSMMTAKLWICLVQELAVQKINTLGDLYMYLNRHQH